MTFVTSIKTEIVTGPETNAQFLCSIPREGEGNREKKEERGEIIIKIIIIIFIAVFL